MKILNWFRKRKYNSRLDVYARVQKILLKAEPQNKLAKKYLAINDSLLEARIEAIRNDRSRNRYKVSAKCELIKELREVHKLTFPAIGKLMDNDHTTILYLYYKHRDGYSYKGVKKL